MKFFQKRSVAVVLTLLIILASIGLGQVRRPVQSSPAPEPADPSALDTSLNTSGYTDWLWDEAGVLSDATEETLCLYNANWDARYGMIMAVAAVSDTDGMAIDTYTYQLGNDIGLGSQDLLLVMDVGGQDAFLIPGDSVTSALSDSVITQYMDQHYDAFMARDYDTFALGVFSSFQTFFASHLNAAQSTPAPGYAEGYARDVSWVVQIFFLILLILIVFSIIDSTRYTAYRRRYYGRGSPRWSFAPFSSGTGLATAGIGGAGASLLLRPEGVHVPPEGREADPRPRGAAVSAPVPRAAASAPAPEAAASAVAGNSRPSIPDGYPGCRKSSKWLFRQPFDRFNGRHTGGCRPFSHDSPDSYPG